MRDGCDCPWWVDGVPAFGHLGEVPPTRDAVALLEWPAFLCVCVFLFQLLLLKLEKKLESIPRQKADLAAGGYPCAKGGITHDCSPKREML